MVAIFATGPIAGFPVHAEPWKIVPAADLTEAAIEQLDFLAEHARLGFCVDRCSLCARLLAAREILLNPFEPTKDRPN